MNPPCLNDANLFSKVILGVRYTKSPGSYGIYIINSPSAVPLNAIGNVRLDIGTVAMQELWTANVTIKWCLFIVYSSSKTTIDTLQWRHNEHVDVSKTTSKLHVTGLCVENSPVTGEFPAQKTSNAGNVSIWWRHHDISLSCVSCCVSILRICGNINPATSGYICMVLVMK